MSKSDGGPAFPVPTEIYENSKGEHKILCDPSMSVRTYAAIQVAAGIVANPNIDPDILIADMAYKIADALIAEGEKDAT